MMSSTSLLSYMSNMKRKKIIIRKKISLTFIIISLLMIIIIFVLDIVQGHWIDPDTPREGYKMESLAKGQEEIVSFRRKKRSYY